MKPITGARRRARCAAAAAAALLAPAAHASFLPKEMVDTAATYLAWFIIVVVPIGAIVLFWLVHILPEKIAEKRHHPQKDAINVLCLLSLVFGGLLWPLAWLWAYTKPIGYRAAYGTDKHEDYFLEMVERAEKGEIDAVELQHLCDELASIEARGALTPELRQAKARLDARADSMAVAATPPEGQPQAIGAN